MATVRVAILTVSDGVAAGRRDDLSGRAIREVVEGLGWVVADYRVVPDEASLIMRALREWADRGLADLILTTGGTGVAPRDVTPEATAAVIERPVPGLAEAIRIKSLEFTPFAMLSRGIAGIRGRTLIINLPGSPQGVRQALGIIGPALPHAVELLREEPTDHRPHAH
jgi:molybdenum cofactor synthesis domain-containing protein